MSFLARGTKNLASRLQKTGTFAARRSYTTHSQLPEEQRMLYEMCRRFADEEIAPNAREWDQKHSFPSKVKDLVRERLGSILDFFFNRSGVFAVGKEKIFVYLFFG